MKTALALALLILPLAAAPLAEARKAQADTTLKVSQADLDLTQPRDAAILLTRVEKVARSWCVEPGHQSTTTASCIRMVMTDVVGRVDEPAVTAAWIDRIGPAVRLASR